MFQRLKKFYTPEEYLALEVSAAYKSEYFQGEIFAMAGGSRNHSLITANIIAALNQGLVDKPCEVHTSDMRLLVEANGLYTYPDVMVVCGKPQFLKGRNDTLINPILIVEVLSPSTHAYDRVKKFSMYREIDSLRGYLLVDSEQVHVTYLERASRRGRWFIEMLDRVEAVVNLKAIDCELALSRMYSKVEFEQRATP